MTTRFDADYEGIGGMLCMSWMQQEMRRRAELVKAEAERIAPQATEGDDPGEYARSFSVSSGVRTDGTPRAYGRVENTSPEALPVEYGWKATPKYRVLGRALAAAGDEGAQSPYRGDPTKSHKTLKAEEKEARRQARRAKRRAKDA